MIDDIIQELVQEPGLRLNKRFNVKLYDNTHLYLLSFSYKKPVVNNQLELDFNYKK